MSRAEQKERTRQAIIQAALQFCEDKHIASLGLREITREVGIAPAAFYHHFKSIDELSLTLLGEVGQTLRQLMRHARMRVQIEGSVINTSVDTFMEFVADKPQHFRILGGERSGGPSAFRQALRKQRQQFVQDLIDDLSADTDEQKSQLAHIPEASELMVNQVLAGGIDALDMSDEEREILSQRLKLQLRITMAGCKALALKN